MDSSPADGVYVNGIFIDGARWDKNRGVLAEQIPKVLIEGMPAIHLTVSGFWFSTFCTFATTVMLNILQPIKILELPNDSRYKCPLYKTTERRGILSTTGHSTNFVLHMLLKTNQNASHWIKRSAALICQTNDWIELEINFKFSNNFLPCLADLTPNTRWISIQIDCSQSCHYPYEWVIVDLQQLNEVLWKALVHLKCIQLVFCLQKTLNEMLVKR